MTLAGSHWLVVGAGYTGIRLSRNLLNAGAAVAVTRRSVEAAAELKKHIGESVEPFACILSQEAAVQALPFRDRVVVLLSPPDSEGPRAEAQFVRTAVHAGARRIIYVSSTGVYPPGNGEWIDEDSVVAPVTRHGEARLAAEREVLDVASRMNVPVVSLRAAGIYGPHRGVHEKIRAGGYRVVGDGATFVNRIHVDDLGGAIVRAASVATFARRAYNVADDQPATAREVADWIARRLGVPLPGSMPVEEASPMARDLLLGNRRIRNRRLKEELGVALAYPTYREGVEQALGEEAA